MRLSILDWRLAVFVLPCPSYGRSQADECTYFNFRPIAYNYILTCMTLPCADVVVHLTKEWHNPRALLCLSLMNISCLLLQYSGLPSTRYLWQATDAPEMPLHAVSLDVYATAMWAEVTSMLAILGWAQSSMQFRHDKSACVLSIITQNGAICCQLLIAT